MTFRPHLLIFALAANWSPFSHAEPSPSTDGLKGKVIVGYQGWFRAPNDAAKLGWAHWSRDPHQITPKTLTFDMWPDMSEYPKSSQHLAPGFTFPNGKPATLFSSDDAQVVRKHFEWMQEHDIDGVYFQHFIIDFPGAPAEARYASRKRVLDHVREAAKATHRVFAITFDLSGVKADQVFDLVSTEWRKLVDEGVTKDPLYLKEQSKPVVMLFGIYADSDHNEMSAPLVERLQHFFQSSGPYQAFLGGAGDWRWRDYQDPHWHRVLRQFDAFSPWNIANYWTDEHGATHATTEYWKDDREKAEKHGMLWIPTLYPGFSWENLKTDHTERPSLARRGGNFLWEQFVAAQGAGAETLMIAMFDEVDEGTAVFKVSNDPPVEAKFVTYEGFPSDWYLRLIREASKNWKLEKPIPKVISITP